MSDTSNWKNSESLAAKALSDFGIPAKRKTRSGNWGESTFDLTVGGEKDELVFNPIVDSKYSKARPFQN